MYEVTVPNEKSKIKIPGMDKIPRGVFSDNRGAHREELVKDVEHHNLT
jgi:hypothetical protein